MPDGPVPDSPVPDGTMPDGAMPDGAMPDGPMPDGPSRAPREFGFEDPGDVWLQHLRAAVGAAAPIDRLGDYEVLGEVSRGGQGIVYRARDVRSGEIVALKRLRHGTYSTPTEIERFQREVTLAAALEHPGIVGVRGFELADGQPTMALEWIDGEPVSAWARPGGQRRPVDELLAVAVQLCDAVHFAHQHGVLHRDLKPSNVLVDPTGAPRVVDFGIAKPLDVDRTGLTASDEFVGTLAYAAPEQLRGGPLAVDVRADVYAIGAILFEALTGRRPHEVAHSLADAVDAVEQGKIDRPSAHGQGVSFELDTIVLKAMAADPGLRYQSVDALREDLRRLRGGEPILAHPPSTWYQIRKLVSRHRGVCASGLMVLVLGVALTVVTAVQSSAVLRAQEREALAAELAQSVAGYMHELFRGISPAQAGEAASVLGIVERATERIDLHFDREQPMRADLRSTLGHVLSDLGQLDLAARVLREAQELREAQGSSLATRLAARLQLAAALDDLSDYRGAATQYRAARDLLAAAEDPKAHAFVRADIDRHLAEILLLTGDVATADERAEAALAVLLARPDAPREVLAGARRTMARLYAHHGDLDAAADQLRRAVALSREAYGDLHPVLAEALFELAQSARSRGEPEEAKSLLVEAEEICRRLLADDHPLRGRIHGIWGRLHLAAGELEPAKERLDRAHDILVRVRGGRHESLAAVLSGRVQLAWRTGDVDRAEQVARESLRILEENAPDDPWLLPAALNNLATVLAKRQGETARAEAEQHYRAALALQERGLGPDHPRCIHPLNGLATLALNAGDLDTATSLFGRCVALGERCFPRGHWSTLVALGNLAIAHRDRANLAAAAPGDEAQGDGPQGDEAQGDEAPRDYTTSLEAFRRALAMADAIELAAAHPDRVWILHEYSAVLDEAGDVEGCLAALRRIVAAEPAGSTADRFLRSRYILASILIEQGRSEQALGHLDTLATQLRDRPEQGPAGAKMLARVETKIAALRQAETPAAK
ncbi:MAG: serine/threonine-protein kinase [Planctomycetota bacterium]